MKIETVEALIEDILGIPESAVEVANEWLALTEIFRKAIATATDLLIIDTYSNRYGDCAPYLQICFEDDGAMTIEATSNKFLTPKLSVDAQNTMMELGWQLSDEQGLPNYYQFNHAEDGQPQKIAELFTKTLRDAYGISPFDEMEVSTGRGVWPSSGESSSNA